MWDKNFYPTQLFHFIVFWRLNAIWKNLMVTKFFKNFNKTSIRKAVVFTKLLIEITRVYLSNINRYLSWRFIYFFFLSLESCFCKAFFFFLYGPKHFVTIIILHQDWIFVAEYPWIIFFSLIFSTQCIFSIALSMNCLASV